MRRIDIYMKTLLSIFFALIICGSISSAEEKQTDSTIPKEEFISVGQIRVFSDAGVVEVDGYICLNKGVIEYIICAEKGKEYESVVALKCIPSNLNLALMLIGVIPADVIETETSIKQPFIKITVEWGDDENKTVVNGSELAYNRRLSEVMQNDVWKFTGSAFEVNSQDGSERFLADRDGVIVATYKDPAALFNNTLEDSNDDTAYEANTDALPATRTPVIVRFEISKVEAKP